MCDTNAYRADTSVACAHDTIPYDQPHDHYAIVSERIGGSKRKREREGKQTPCVPHTKHVLYRSFTVPDRRSIYRERDRQRQRDS